MTRPTGGGVSGAVGPLARLRERVRAFVQPTPESIRLVALRGGPQVVLGGVDAGASKQWRTTVVAAEDSVLLVLATANVEHGLGPLDDAPETNVELAAFVDGARIGRAVETVRPREDRVLTCAAPIRVAPGVREVRVTLKPFAAGVTLGDVTVAALLVPETIASVSVVRP